MAGSEPRKHHVVPASLLARFTPAGTKEDFLFVTDRQRGERWRTKPSGAAHQRDFYVLANDRPDPYVLEKLFGEVEGEAAGAIDRTIAANVMPTGDDFKTLMYFISLLSVRTPAARAIFGKLMLGILEPILKKVQAEPGHRDKFDRIMADAGHIPDENGKFGELEEAFTGIQIELTQEYHMAALINMQQIILPLLSARKWCVMKAVEGDFVCSDNPVRLEWTNPDAGQPFPPGFGVGETECTIPLDKTTVLSGRFETMKSNVTLSKKDVAVVNARTIKAARQVYSSAENFLWFDEQKRVQFGGMYEMDEARVQAAKKDGGSEGKK